MTAVPVASLQPPSNKPAGGQGSQQPRIVRRLVPQRDQHVLTQLESLEKRLFKKAESWTGLFSKEVVRRNTVLLYVSSDDSSQVVAYIVYTTNSSVAHIAKLAVRDDLRRQGLARVLVQAALDIAARERRVGSCTLHVDTANTPAVRLYTSLGFAVEAELEDYYSQGRSAYKMRLELGSSNY